MLYRKIANKIESFLKNEQETVLLIDGARQIGKSYIIRWVASRMFKNYIEINMEEDKVGARTFANVCTTSDFYVALSTIAGKKMGDASNTIVFIDEIQAYSKLLTLLKFLKAENKFTYIASGSQLGVALKSTSSIPIGSITMERMYPLDFEEFLMANGVGDVAINAMREAFVARQPLDINLHNKILDLFRKYMIVGGLPAAVNAFVAYKNIQMVRTVHHKILELYSIDASKHEQENGKKLKIRRIYSMVPSLLENKKKRVVAKDIEDKQWKRMENYADEFDYLISSGITLDVKAISNPRFPLVESMGKNLIKLYLNDVGLLSCIYYVNNILPVMNDQLSINLGSIYETVVAQEFRAHGYNLYYYDNKKNGEVDFLIDDYSNLAVLPIEVKSGKDYKIHSALTKFLANDDYTVADAVVLSNEPDVYIQKGVTYMPIYYVMFFNKEEAPIVDFE